MVTSITNYETYEIEMTKAIYDKMFFIDKVDAKIFFDYGCADGSLIFAIDYFTQSQDDYFFIGYDNDKKVIKDAKNCVNVTEIANFYDNLDKANNMFFYVRKARPDRKTCLVLSSLLHELYWYETQEEIEKFWQWVNYCKFDYIVIRDMVDIGRDHYGDNHNLDQIQQQIFHQMKTDENLKTKVDEFSAIWGPISHSENAVHFLLKYRYIINWSREVEENYMSVSVEELNKRKPEGYDEEMSEVFVHPFIKKKIDEDFAHGFNIPTHIKLIWKKE